MMGLLAYFYFWCAWVSNFQSKFLDIVEYLWIALQQNRVFQYQEDSYSAVGDHLLSLPMMDDPKSRKRERGSKQ